MRKELVEKQELLSQAAKAFQLHEEQKEAAARNQAQYQQSLDDQRRRIEQLELGKYIKLPKQFINLKSEIKKK